MLSLPFQKSNTFRILFFSITVLIINICGGRAVIGKVRLDSTFVPVLGMRTYGLSSALVLPDGKLVVVRLSSQDILGDEQYKVTRLNADGSVDRIFDSVVLSRGDAQLSLQSNGKILVRFSNIITNGQNRGGLVRLNADGTLDTSFNPVGILYAGGCAIQPDGKIIVGTLYYDQNDGLNRGGTFRLNADGSRDQSFTPFTYFNAPPPTVVTLQPDGKILVGFGQYSSARIERLNADGTRDVAFSNNLPSSSGSGALYSTTSIIIQSDGSIIVGGAGVMRLYSNGMRDFDFPAYATYSSYNVYGMILQPDGKILIGGTGGYNFSNIPPPLKKRLTRINADGTQDMTFDAMTSESFGYDALIPLALRPDGRILVSYGFSNTSVAREGFMTLNANGTLDQSFSPDLGLVSGTVTHLKAQPDGKILMAGFFVRVNDFPTLSFARLNPDGSTDTDFSFTAPITNTAQGVSFIYAAIAFQADGKILIGGNFRFNNQENYGVFRLNQNGSLDSSFTPLTFTYPTTYQFAQVNSLAVQADGKILVGGNFQNYGNSGRNYLVRLNTDGSVDASYDATATIIGQMFVQPGGKILVSGTLTVNGITKTNPRLNTDGTIDPTFNMPTDVGSIFAVAPDGKVATAGSFPYGKTSVYYVFRLNADGSRDPSFVPQRFFESIYNIVFQNDGRIIVSVASSLVRLDGSNRVQTLLQNVFNVRALLVTSDDKLIVGGQFSAVAGARRTGIARILLNANDVDFDGDGRADVSVFRPSDGIWYLLNSQSGFDERQFGAAGDKLVPADYDSDGKTDVAVYRDGIWYLQRSTLGFTAVQFGEPTDIPVPADFDADGKDDIAVYRPSNGTWFIQKSQLGFTAVQFGLSEDKPVAADFDGDGKADYAVFRPSTGTWYVQQSRDGFTGLQFGSTEDKVVAADYDGDGKADFGVFRPSNGFWYIQRSQLGFTSIQFGISTDIPVPADYDGDGKTDIGVYRNDTWLIQRSTSGFTGVQFGGTGDKPIPTSYVC